MQSPIKNGQKNAFAKFFAVFRESLINEERDYTRGSLRRALALLAIPMMLEMSMEAIFALADIFFVAKLGADAVAVVGITEAMITILYAVAIGLSMSATAMVARRIGEKDTDAAAFVAGQAIWIGLALSLVIGITGALFAKDLLQFMGASDAIVDSGSGYTAILLGGSASIFYLFLLNAIFRGAGDAAIALRSLWIANGINIVLDPCLIFGLGPFPEMGVTGAAVATTIGRSVGVLYQLLHLTNGAGRLHMRLRHFGIRLPVLLRLLRISLSGMGQFLIATSSWIFLMRILTTFGSAPVAGFTIALRLMEFFFLPAWGLGNAAATLVGQNLGASEPLRAAQSAWKATKYNVIFMGTVAVLFVTIPQTLILVFTSDENIVAAGTLCLRVMGLGFPLYAVGMILTQSINGAGDTFTPMLLNLVSFWMIQIPLAAWLAYSTGFGFGGVAWAIVISESLLSVFAVFVFRSGRWKLVKV